MDQSAQNKPLTDNLSATNIEDDEDLNKSPTPDAKTLNLQDTCYTLIVMLFLIPIFYVDYRY